MMTEEYLYRLSRFSKPGFTVGRPKGTYVTVYAKPVFAGPDAAIEVEDNAVRTFIHGEPSYPGGQFSKLVGPFQDQILAAAIVHRTEETRKIVFSGTWHHIDFEADPRFEGCLLHKVGRDGSVSSKLYNEHIFAWDATPCRAGYGFNYSAFGDLNDLAEDLGSMADYQVCKERGRYKGASGLGAVGGMLWLTDEASQIPFHYSTAKPSSEIEVEFKLDEDEEEYNTGQPIVGDGSLSAAVMSKLAAVKRENGWFRGHVVAKSSHRPRKLKLSEVPDAIDAIGYWVQARTAAGRTSSEFRLFGGMSDWQHEVLEKVEDGNANDLLGNLFVSDWIYEPTRDQADREIRLLTLGPIPKLSPEPV